MTHATFLADAQELRPRLVGFDMHDGRRCAAAMSAVVAGGGSTFALAAGTGELWGWGRLADRSSIAAEKFIASPSSRLCVHAVSVVSVRDFHAALVTVTGALFTWGEGSQGQLGHGFGMDYDQPREVEIPAITRGAAGQSLRPDIGRNNGARSPAPRVVNVACSSFATLILTERGELCVSPRLLHACRWSHEDHLLHLFFPLLTVACHMVLFFGRMMCGQLPRSSVHDSREGETNVVGGDTLATTGAWDWGISQAHPHRQAPYDGDLVAIHDILVGNASESNNREEPAMVPVLSPTPVVALRGITVRGIACGQDYFGAVTNSSHGRRLYAWGRLHARSAIVAQPTLVTIPAPQSTHVLPLNDVSLVAMGMEHAAALVVYADDDCSRKGSDRVRLWTWGSGTQGQLGHGDTISASLPREVAGLSELVEEHGMVTSIAAGNEHTVLMFEDGALCAFGCGYFGRLGLGTEENWARPRLLGLGGQL